MLPMILLAALATVSATSSHSSLAQQRGKGAALSSTSRHPASDTLTVGQLQRGYNEVIIHKYLIHRIGKHEGASFCW